MSCCVGINIANNVDNNVDNNNADNNSADNNNLVDNRSTDRQTEFNFIWPVVNSFFIMDTLYWSVVVVVVTRLLSDGPMDITIM